MKKVLILTAGFGEGHNAAARICAMRWNWFRTMSGGGAGFVRELLRLLQYPSPKNAYQGVVQYAQNLGGHLFAPGQFRSWKTVWEASAA